MTALRSLSRPEGAVRYGVQWHVEDDRATRSEVFAEALADLPHVLEREGWDQLGEVELSLRMADGETFVEAHVLVVASMLNPRRRRR